MIIEKDSEFKLVDQAPRIAIFVFKPYDREDKIREKYYRKIKEQFYVDYDHEILSHIYVINTGYTTNQNSDLNNFPTSQSTLNIKKQIEKFFRGRKVELFWVGNEKDVAYQMTFEKFLQDVKEELKFNQGEINDSNTPNEQSQSSDEKQKSITIKSESSEDKSIRNWLNNKLSNKKKSEQSSFTCGTELLSSHCNII